MLWVLARKLEGETVNSGHDQVVLLDRDGVLNADLPNYVQKPEELVALPAAVEALRLLSEAGYRNLVITNQQCVTKGLVSLATLDAIHSELRRQVELGGGGRIDGVYVCPHPAGAGCGCRKPRPGLIERARAEWGFDPAVTWMVGDKFSDVGAARAAGCLGALVRSGHAIDEDAARRMDVPVFEDLLDFVRRQLGLG
ncbi:MAG: hypothetical protein A2289_22560 [Deltaproteobacteria bacterium RIFOXYA12_FULL_58_15]|nr:MAG: hypothetical protein A2289_22560 [Deltaproteobacteria bacterium RIFOXYA12_FULL_58_15]